MEIKQLSDERAVEVLASVATTWISRRGVEALIVYQGAIGRSSGAEPLPAWATGKLSVTPESASLARHALSAINSGSDDEAREWLRGALERANKAQAQLLDPVSMLIGGAVLIGVILAARVKKIGSVEFYQGVPKEVVDIVKTGANVVVK